MSHLSHILESNEEDNFILNATENRMESRSFFIEFEFILRLRDRRIYIILYSMGPAPTVTCGIRFDRASVKTTRTKQSPKTATSHEPKSQPPANRTEKIIYY